jgi:hypothetical protein
MIKYLFLLLPIVSLAQSSKIIKSQTTVTSTDIQATPGASGTISLTDTTKFYKWIPAGGDKVLNWSVPGDNQTTPSILVQAESYSAGTNVEKVTDTKTFIRPISGWLPWSATYQVAFTGQSKMTISYANGGSSSACPVNIGGVVKTLPLPNSGGWGTYTTAMLDLGVQTGTKTVLVSWVSGFNVDSFTFAK